MLCTLCIHRVILLKYRFEIKCTNRILVYELFEMFHTIYRYSAKNHVTLQSEKFTNTIGQHDVQHAVYLILYNTAQKKIIIKMRRILKKKIVEQKTKSLVGL